MLRLRAFQTAAHKVGFVEVSKTAEGTVQWLKKSMPSTTTRDNYQRMCIDTLTNSVTVYWLAVPGDVNSKTFRGVSAFQAWLDAPPISLAKISRILER